MVRNYNQHSREIVELKSGSNSQKKNTNGNKCLFSQVSWLGKNVSKLFADDWKFISLKFTINIIYYWSTTDTHKRIQHISVTTYSRNAWC